MAEMLLVAGSAICLHATSPLVHHQGAHDLPNEQDRHCEGVLNTLIFVCIKVRFLRIVPSLTVL